MMDFFQKNNEDAKPIYQFQQEKSLLRFFFFVHGFSCRKPRRSGRAEIILSAPPLNITGRHEEVTF
jgi:hypothetical protein